MMKRSLFALTSGLSLMMMGLAAMPSQAQQPDEMNYQQNESSSIYGTSNNRLDPYSFIHRMRLHRDSEAFQQNANGSFNDEAAAYHQQLLQYWQTQKQKQHETQPTVTNPEVIDGTTTPDTAP